MDDPKIYWVGFNYVKGIGAVRFRVLLEAFGDAERAWHAPIDALRQTGLSARIIENLLSARKSLDLAQIHTRMAQQGIQALTWEDEAYPRRLHEIDQPPPVLYVRGSLTPDDQWAVALVGTRRMTGYGRQVTEELAATLAQQGVTVVSGLARGVDAVAHQAALTAGGRTLAVLGCGVDVVYPPEHRRLAEQIIAQGALISDYPPGTGPDAANFPPRNRIISGLSLATVVVEAGETSGALITARFAADQGRDVFAVPGQIYAPSSKGTNRLLRDGAQPMLSPADVLESLNLSRVVQHQEARRALPADPLEALLLGVLSREALHIDEIQARASLPVEQVSAALAMMELKGMVRQLGGMNYTAVAELPAEYDA